MTEKSIPRKPRRCSQLVGKTHWLYECPLKPKDPIVLNLQNYIRRKARPHLDLPVDVEITDNLKMNWEGQPYTHTVFTKEYDKDDKRYKEAVVRYGIWLNKSHYKKFKHDPNEMKQLAIHELAHLISDKRSEKEGVRHHHDTYFKNIARELGADEEHTRAVKTKKYHVSLLLKHTTKKLQSFKSAKIGDIFIFDYDYKNTQNMNNWGLWVKVRETGYITLERYDTKIKYVRSPNQQILVVDHMEK
jgi:predicted SprT family Zn-dependent metalloprotease